MLTIRQPQIEKMMQGQKEKVANVIALNLRETVPFFQHYSDKQLQYWVNTQIDYLATINIHEKNNVHTIIDVIALYGDKFERCPDPSWALSILENLGNNEGIRAILLKRAHKRHSIY